VERAGPELLPASHFSLALSITPGGLVSRLSLQAHLGAAIDYVAYRAGRGGDAVLSVQLRATRHLELQYDGAIQWLNLSGERLFTAQVERLKATYVFGRKTFLRAIGQYVRTDSDPSRYPVPVPATAGGFQGSLLFGYELNWQSVVYLGYGDARELTENARPVKAGRDFFLKVSYAFQR
jgi:hypothetical protein